MDHAEAARIDDAHLGVEHVVGYGRLIGNLVENDDRRLWYVQLLSEDTDAGFDYGTVVLEL